jgi:type IV secretory pathway VirB4 component
MNAKTLAFLRTLTDEYIENELTPAIGKTMARYLWMYEENRIQYKEKVQALEDIINQLKGEKGKVNIPANKDKP